MNKKTIHVPNLKTSGNICEKGNIDNNNWDYPACAKVDFEIQHDDSSIIITYNVEETDTMAVNTEINGSVWEDSCTEFFISFDKKNYYNLECNCIGTILGGYGPGRNNREALPIEVLKNIKTYPSLGKKPVDIDGTTKWQMKIEIPVSTFIYSEIKNLAGIKANCNFYKCGDKQKQAHFLSWNPIKTENPDFHVPQYFGEIEFNK